MDRTELFKMKHELWLEYIYTGVAVENALIKSTLSSFARTYFLHLKWLGTAIMESIENTDYENDEGTLFIPKMFSIERESLAFEGDNEYSLLFQLETRNTKIMKLYDTLNMTDPTLIRMKHDDAFFLKRLRRLKTNASKIPLPAFDENSIERKREFAMNDVMYQNLRQTLQKQAQKEYITVMSTFYIYIHSFNAQPKIASILLDLIRESTAHMKYYAKLMAYMGMIALPKPLAKGECDTCTLKDFIDKSIKDEIQEMSDLHKEAKVLGNTQFNELAEFIAHQEQYHIHLLKTAQKLLENKTS